MALNAKLVQPYLNKVLEIAPHYGWGWDPEPWPWAALGRHATPPRLQFVFQDLMFLNGQINGGVGEMTRGMEELKCSKLWLLFEFRTGENSDFEQSIGHYALYFRETPLTVEHIKDPNDSFCWTGWGAIGVPGFS